MTWDEIDKALLRGEVEMIDRISRLTDEKYRRMVEIRKADREMRRAG